METEESSFTLRMLQRASLRRSNNNLCRSGIDLKRRLSIMDAIEDKAIKNRRMSKGFNSTSPPCAGKASRRYSTSPSELENNICESQQLNLGMQRAENNRSEQRCDSRLASSFNNSFNDSEEFNKDLSLVSVTSSRRSGDFDSFKWRRPHYGGSYQVKARSNDERSILVEEMLKPQLIKVTERELESPRRIQLDAGNLRESRSPMSAEMTEGNAQSAGKIEQERNNDYTNSSMTSISRAIDELDREIRYLEFRREAYDKTRAEAFDQMNSAIKERETKPPRKFLPVSTNNLRSVRSLKNRHAAKELNNVAVNVNNPYTGLRRILEDTAANQNRQEVEMTEESKEAAWDDSACTGGVEPSEFAKTDEENNNDVNLATMENAVPRFTKNPALHAGKMQRCQKILPNLESTRRSSKFDLTKKTSQTNMESTISSITTFATQMTSESMQESRKNGNYENTIPSEVERFLEDALGDELNNTSVTYAQADGRDAMSQYNASEFISDVDSLGRKDVLAAAAAAAAAAGRGGFPPKYYGTLDRTRTLYRSFTQRLKKKLHSRLKDRRYVISNPIVLPKRETEKMQMLLQELEIQQTLLYQASKALNLCYAMKNFTAGPEHVESERLLLLTDLKKKAISDEIKRIGSPKPPAAYGSDPSRERGEITIKDIVLPLNKNTLQVDSSADKMEWFVVTISQGSTVWASHAIPRHANDTKIDFPESVSVPNLSPDFKILLRVYSLQLKVLPVESKVRNHQSSTGHWKNPCSTVRKIWRRTQKPLSTKQRQILCTSVRNTSFSLLGQLQLSLEDISLCSPWTMSMVQANSTLTGTIELNLSCKLHVSVTHAGFLTHGDEAGGYAVWNRRWCVLEGHILKFWNYPQEQESKGPLGCIDLMHCVTHEVGMIDRQLCAKPRTFVIRTARPKSVQDHDSMLLECRAACTVVRNLLSCDTVDELMEWTTKLNHVISLLHEWNAITTYDAVEISDL